MDSRSSSMSSSSSTSSMEGRLQVDESELSEESNIKDIIGEMKNHFNNSSTTEKNEEETSGEISTVESEESEPRRIVISIRKKENKVTTRSAKGTNNNNNNDTSPKRSMRRRSKDCKESVLQSAIARKEKSYNETSKPQRLTRQLKATQKILDNIASAAAASKKNCKKRNGKEINNDFSSNNNKRLKSSDLEMKTRRSERLSSQVNEIDERGDEIINKTIKSDEIESDEKDENEKLDEDDDYVMESSVTDELIASRLCVCTVRTPYYPLNEANNNVYCNALDTISGRLIGCNNKVSQEVPMQRPSTRIPYMVLCNIHRKRLIDHHCCPTCGIFCTHGDFLECADRHYFHKNCQLSVGDLECCPHCGDQGKKYNVKIILKTDDSQQKKPNNIENQIGSTEKTKVKVEKCSLNEEENSFDRDKTSNLLHNKLETTKIREQSPPIVDIDGLKDIQLNRIKTDKKCDHTIEDLYKEIKAGHYAEVATILSNADIDLETLIEYDDGNNDDESAASGTILHYSARNGLLPIIHMLKIAEINLNVLDAENNTPLMIAIVHFQNETVKYLCKAGACVSTKSTDGMTALHLSAKCGNLEATKELLLAAAHVKGFIDFVDDGGWSPLVWACEHGHLDVVKYLLTEGADLKLADVEENVALHWAAFNGNCSILELIINFGADIDSINMHGDTPLHIAARQDNYNAVLVLLARGAQIYIENSAKKTALNCCPKESQSFQALSINDELHRLIRCKGN